MAVRWACWLMLLYHSGRAILGDRCPVVVQCRPRIDKFTSIFILNAMRFLLLSLNMTAFFVVHAWISRLNIQGFRYEEFKVCRYTGQQRSYRIRHSQRWRVCSPSMEGWRRGNRVFAFYSSDALLKNSRQLAVLVVREFELDHVL